MAKKNNKKHTFATQETNSGPSTLEIDAFRNAILQSISKEHTELDRKILVVNAVIKAAISSFFSSYKVQFFDEKNIAEFYTIVKTIKSMHEIIKGDVKFTIDKLGASSENLQNWLHAINQVAEFKTPEGKQTKEFLYSLQKMYDNKKTYTSSLVQDDAKTVLKYLQANQYDNNDFSFHCQEHLPDDQYKLLWFLSSQKCFDQVYAGIKRSLTVVNALNVCRENSFTLLDSNTQDIKDFVISIKALHSRNFQDKKSTFDIWKDSVSTWFSPIFGGSSKDSEKTLTLKDVVFRSQENIDWFTDRTQTGAENVATKYDNMYLALSSTTYTIRANNYVCVKIANEIGVDEQICNLYSSTLNNLIKLTSSLPAPFMQETRNKVEEMEKVDFEDSCKEEQCEISMTFKGDKISIKDVNFNSAFNDQHQKMLEGTGGNLALPPADNPADNPALPPADNPELPLVGNPAQGDENAVDF